MIWKIVGICLLVACVAINLVIARKMSVHDMYESFVKGQCVVGMVCANIFYSLAWTLKGLRYIVLVAIK